MLELEEKYARNFMFSEPILYKDCTYIFPLRFININQFKIAVTSLLYNPLDYSDLELSTLPRLYFLTDVLGHTNDIEFLQSNQLLLYLLTCLSQLLTLAVGKDKFDYIPKGSHFVLRLFNNQETKNEGPEYIDLNSSDFDELREIILQQNGCEYIDEFVHADIRRFLEEEDQRAKNDDDSISTDEDCMEAVMLELGISNETELANMSMRRYNHLLSKILNREQYVIQTTAAMSGFVKFEKMIPHWLGRQKMEARYKRAFKKL